jgi:nitroreductase
MTLLERMKNRRTIRRYAERDVPEELIDGLLEIAVRASNTGNMQLYSIVVSRGGEVKEQLAPAHLNQRMVTEAPVVLTFCADTNRFFRWASQRKAEAGFDNLQGFLAASIDAVIAAQAFCTAAEARGLGLCYLGTTTYCTEKIIEVLSLPKRVVPVVSVTVGWPAETPDQPDRLPLEGIVHRERYVDYTQGEIDALYETKEHCRVNEAYVRENGKETLAQVFTEIRYKRGDNECFSEAFLCVLKKQGFYR